MRDINGAKAGSSQKKPYRAPVSATSVQTMRIKYGISEGTIRGFGKNATYEDMLKRIYLDGTPIMSAEGEKLLDVVVEFREGSQDQDPISGLPSIAIEHDVGVEVKLAAPVSRSFTRDDTNSYDVRISVPSLYEGDSDGNSRQGTIRFRIDVSTDSGAFVSAGEFTIKEKILNGYSNTYRVEVPKGSNHVVRVVRLNSEVVNDYSVNKLIVDSIVENTDVRLRYSNTAILYLEYNAEQFSNIPKLEMRIFGKNDILVPANYNEATRTYATSGAGTTNGVWNGTWKRDYTDNPVWIALDLILASRYGLGDKINLSNINKWELYAIAQYCDELVDDGKGGREPRFTCNNAYLQKAEDAYRVLKDLTASFRAKVVWDGEYLTFSADTPRDPVFVFTNANTRDITYSSTQDAAQRNLINVQFYDKENKFASDVVMQRSRSNILSRGKVVDGNFTALGCTSRGQAQRSASYVLNTEIYETEIVSFTTGLEGGLVRLNDVFMLADYSVAGRTLGGRIAAVAGNTVTLDREIPAEVTVTSETKLVVNQTSSEMTPISVVSISADRLTVTLETAPPAGTEAGLVWALLTHDLVPQQFYVTDIAFDAAEMTYAISGLQYNASKYAAIDGSARIVTPPISVVEYGMLKAPLAVIASYNVNIVQDISVCNIDVSWSQSSNAVQYQLEMQKEGTEWKVVGRFASLSTTLENMYTGSYTFRVCAYDSLGNASQYTYSDPLLVAGKVLPPPVLSHYTVKGILFGYQHDWIYPAHTEDSRAVRLRYTTIDPVANNTQDFMYLDVAYPTTKFVEQDVSIGLVTWFSAAIVDKYGNVGEWTAWQSATPTVDADEVLTLLDGQITSGQLDQDLRTDIATGVTAGQIADDAKALATEAKTAANSAVSTSAAAQTASNAANTAASNAQTAASSAQSAASAAQTAANTAKTTADQAKADVAALTTSTSQAQASLQQQLDTTADGLTQEITDRQAGDTAVVGQLNTYKTSNDAAVAAVQQQASSAATSSSANATALTNLTATVNTKNRTYQQTTAPTANLVTGDLWINTTAGKNNEMKRWSGTAWTVTVDPRIASTATALATLTTNVETIDGKTTTNSSDIVSLRNDLTTTNNTVSQKADSSALTALNSTVTQQGNAITSQGTRVTNLENSVNHATTGLSTKASSAALNTLDNKVTAIDGRVTSNSSSITSLNNSLTTTNTNVSAAQAAATDAMTAAGQKGKVIFGATAPSTADRLAQNLWIDTTGNANTPKRWNGSAWVVVTDKVATDALAAANAASSLAATKADSSALTALDSKVTNIDGKVTTNASNITTLTGRVTTAENNIALKADASALNNIYTKTQTDAKALEIAAGEVSSYDANLVIGGVNLLPNSDYAKGYLPAIGSNDVSKYVNKDVAVTPIIRAVGTVAGNNLGVIQPIAYRTAKVEAGTKYTVSMLISSSLGSLTYLYLMHQSGSVANQSIPYTGVVSTDPSSPTRISVTFTADSSSNGAYIMVANRAQPVGAWLECAELQLEVGTKATSWSPATEDTQESLAANATAINNTNAEVTRVDGRVTTESNRITTLTGRVDTVEGTVATKADGSALTALTTRVTNAEGVNTSQGSAITTLQNTVNHATTGLASKASTSALNTLDSKVTSIDGRVTANASNITNLQSGLTAANNNIATKADGAALTALTTRVSTAEGGLSTVTSNVTKLTAALAAESNSSLQPDPMMTNPDSWISHYSYPMAQYFATVTDGAVAPTVFRKTSANPATCWNYGTKYLSNDRSYKVSMRVRRTSDSTGNAYFTMRYIDKNGAYVNYANAGSILAKIPATNTWTLVEQVIPASTVADVVQVTFGFSLGHVGTVGTWEMQDFRVTDIVTAADTDSTVATAAALSSTDAEVSRINGVVTSQGTSITNLQSGLTTANNNIALKADNSALSSLTTRVTTAEGNIASQNTSITNLTSTLDVAATASANLLANSNVEKPYNADGAYPHGKYDLGVPWEVGATYTLLWCATHQRAAGDTSSYIAAYMGGGNQMVSSITSGDRVIKKQTFVKSASGTSPLINLYLISKPANGVATTATVHWAVLVKGNKILAAEWIPSSFDYKSDVATKADASALNTLNTTVSNLNGTVTAQGTRLTNLEATVNSTVNGLATKASASALDTLSNKVNNSTTGLDAVAAKTTVLESTLGNLKVGGTNLFSLDNLMRYAGGVLYSTTAITASGSTITSSGLAAGDRIGNAVPYSTGEDLTLAFIAVSNVTDGNVYYRCINASGAQTKAQTTASAVLKNGRYELTLPASSFPANTATVNIGIGGTAANAVVKDVIVQYGNLATTWTPSHRDEPDLSGYATAQALTNLTTRVTTAEGNISSTASSLNTLTTTVGNNTASISSQQTSINGLSAKATLQVVANNTIGGVSLGNNAGVVDFIVRANTFAIAPPVSAGAGNAGTYAFNYQATAVTLPNGTVVPAGLYLDQAVIGQISASKINADSLSAISANLGTIKVDTAHIDDLAVTSAKIDNLAVTTAKIKDLSVETLKLAYGSVTSGTLITGKWANTSTFYVDTANSKRVMNWVRMYGYVSDNQGYISGGFCELWLKRNATTIAYRKFSPTQKLDYQGNPIGYELNIQDHFMCLDIPTESGTVGYTIAMSTYARTQTAHNMMQNAMNCEWMLLETKR